MNFRTYIHLDVPKLKCPKCGKTTSYQVNWARPKSGLSRSFEQYCIAMCESMTIKDASLFIKESEKRISLTLNRYKEEDGS
jgi:transposase